VRASAERGVTLIETAILVLVTLSIVGALAPTLSAVILRAETVAATTAMSNIDTQINTILNDMNYTYLNYDGVKNSAQRVNLIVSDGDIPSAVSATGSATWQGAVNGTTIDFIERHLVTNNPGGSGANAYPVPATDAGAGWRGAYLDNPLDPDPWGNRYMVNVEYLGPSNNDVVVYSAGPDEEIDSAYTALNFNTITTDDDLFIIQEAN
jgi:Tfp pilus assembly protein PilE